jgi:hypothetical protein
MQYKKLSSKKRISFLLSVLVVAASLSSTSSARADWANGYVLDNASGRSVLDVTAECQFDSSEAGWLYSAAYLASEFPNANPQISEIVNPSPESVASINVSITPGTTWWNAINLEPSTNYKIYLVLINRNTGGYNPVNDTNDVSNIVVCDVTTTAAAPQVDLTPNNNATEVFIGSNLVIGFGEPVRKIDDSELTDADLADLITFKEDAWDGVDVPFTATINAEKTLIIIDPDAPLDRNQVYFYKMDATVEGLTGVPINGFEVLFTTNQYDTNKGYFVRGTGACWLWLFAIGEDGDLTSSIYDAFILDTCIESQDNELIVGDLYDNFGIGSVDGRGFSWNGTNEFDSDGILTDNQLLIQGEDGTLTEESTYTITFSDNNVTYEIISGDGNDDLLISGVLGSNAETRYFTKGGHNFSYQRNPDTELPYSSPILLWEATDGALVISEGEESLVDGIGSVEVSITGSILQLKHYAYAYRTAEFTSSDEFFDSFLKFVNEDKNRTDVFSIDYGKPKAKPSAPARQTHNLSFDQSFYGSDFLADPKGEIRSILNEINKKYGKLISIK